MMKKYSVVLALVIIVSTLLAACSGNAATPTVEASPVVTEAPTVVVTEAPVAVTTEAATAEVTVAPAMETGVVLPEVDPSAITGDIVSAGSSTVYPLAEAISARFTEEGYAGTLTIDSIGSGAGFDRFCKTGETDISNASVAIKDEQKANCVAIGRDPIGFRVGTDAITVVVNKENDFVKDVTMEQLKAIFTAEKWSDVDPTWPAENILRFIPGTDSGTFSYFVEKVFEKDKEPLLAAANIQLSEDDNVLVQGIEGSKYAIGFFGFAYYNENADNLNVLSIGGVTPDETTAEDGSYPFARPLYLYSDAKVMKDKPQVAAYINYFLTNVNDVIGQVGYFPSSADALDASRQAWLDAMK